MKMFLAIALSIVSFQPAFANEGLMVDQQNAVQVEAGSNAGAIIIGGLIGGIVGAILVDQWRNDDPSYLVCYARGSHGRVFRSYGYGPRRIQDRAMNYCYSRSRYCRPLGCDYAR